jgi:Luciferase-like monooxygenase
MLREAIEIIRALLGGGLVDWRGDYYQVDSARLWDLPDVPVGLAVAMGGKKAIEKFAVLATSGHRAGRRRAGRRADTNLLGPRPGRRHRARPRSVPLVRRWPAGQRRPADTDRFAGATQYVRPEDVAESIPCGPDLDAIVEAVRRKISFSRRPLSHCWTGCGRRSLPEIAKRRGESRCQTHCKARR